MRIQTREREYSLPELTLLYGPAHPGKLDPLLEACRVRVREGRGDTFLIVVPSRRRARALQRMFLLEGEQEAVLVPDILSLSDLIRELYAQCPAPRKVLSSVAQRAIVEDLLRGDAPSYFRRSSEGRPFSGTVTALLNGLSDLMESGLSPEVFEEQRQTLPGLRGAKGEALSFLYRAYRGRLGDRWVDEPGLLGEVAEAMVEAGFRRRFPRTEWVIVEGFDVFTAPLRTVFERIFGWVETACLILDGDPEHPRLFGHVMPVFEHFRARATEVRWAPRENADPLHTTLDQRLFRPEIEGGPLPIEGRIALLPAADRVREVERIARTIWELASEVPWQRMAVTFPRMDLYAPLIREVFPEYGIPFNLSIGFPLSQCPPVVALLAALEVVLNRYHRRHVLRFLHLPYITYTFENGQPLDPDALDRLSRMLRIVEGRRGWLRAIVGRIERLRERMDRLQEGIYDEEGAPEPEEERQRLKAEQEELITLRSGIAHLFRELSALERRMSGDAFRDRIWEMIERFEVVKHILSHGDPSTMERDIRGLERFKRVLDEVVQATTFSRRRNFSLRELYDLLRSALSGATYNVSVPEEYGVQVLGLLEIRGLRFDVLFLGGLVEGECPRPLGSEVFLSDPSRRALGLHLRENRLPEDRFLFYLSLVTARKKGFLSYPGDLVPSSFLSELRRIVEVSEHRPSGFHPHTRAEWDRWFGVACSAPVGDERGSALQTAVRNRVEAEGPENLRDLLRRIKIVDRRTRSGDWTPYEGVLRAPEILRRLRRHFDRQYPFSITQLETYARCPFAFFLQRVLRVMPLEEVEQDLTALERGDLLHRIVYRFYAEGEAPVTPANVDEACARIRAIAEEEMQEGFPSGGFFYEVEKRRIAQDGVDGRPCLLSRFVEQEALEEDRARPRWFELSFGGYRNMGATDAHSSPEPYRIQGTVDGIPMEVAVTGKIDRMDVAEDGRLVVLDYKTGRLHVRGEDILTGLSLQLPIYLLAAEEILRDRIGPAEAVAGGYYHLRSIREVGKTAFFGDVEAQGEVFGKKKGSTLLPGKRSPLSFREALDQSKGFVLHYVRNIREGRFHPSTLDGERACTYCEYEGICRMDPGRARRVISSTCDLLSRC